MTKEELINEIKKLLTDEKDEDFYDKLWSLINNA